jgi:hypothetical protein
MGTFMIRKTKAARTRIRGCKGHYMGLKMGVFFEMGGFNGLDLWGAVKQGECRWPEGIFSGVCRNLRDFFGKTGNVIKFFLESSPTLPDFFIKT